MPFSASIDTECWEKGRNEEEVKKFAEHEWETRLAKIRPDLGLLNVTEN